MVGVGKDLTSASRCLETDFLESGGGCTDVTFWQKGVHERVGGDIHNASGLVAFVVRGVNGGHWIQDNECLYFIEGNAKCPVAIVMSWQAIV